MQGIPDPLRQFPTLYALIDVVEVMILEGMEKQEERDRYWMRTYTPPKGYLQGQAKKSVPRGWDRQSEMDAFDALME